MNKSIIIAAICGIVGLVGGIGSVYMFQPKEVVHPNSLAAISNQQAESMAKVFAAVDADMKKEEDQHPEAEDAPITEYEHLFVEDAELASQICDSLSFADAELCWMRVISEYSTRIRSSGSAAANGSVKFSKEWADRMRYMLNNPNEEYTTCIRKHEAKQISSKERALCTIKWHHWFEMNIRAYQAGVWHDTL